LREGSHAWSTEGVQISHARVSDREPHGKNSTEGKLKSMYFNISFGLDISFLASYVRRRHQDINIHP